MENTDAPALLLLPGFGVGSYHYEHQLQELGQEYRVWAMDFLGQGRSWPSHDPAPLEEVIEEVVEDAKSREWCCGKTPESWASDLVYSVDTWRDQVHSFIDKVNRCFDTSSFLGCPVFVSVDSVGLFL
jgi:pimeloyl-ACP methyl ester carboxylesterase